MKKLLLATVAALAVSGAAQAQDSTLRICTGGSKGNYYAAGVDIAAQLKGAMNVEVVETNGSMQNLEKLDRGECNAAIVQSDAYGVYLSTFPSSKLSFDRVGVLYKEYAHLVCNRESEVEEVGDLESSPESHTILVGEAGSGTAVTWTNWGKLDKTYAKVVTLPIGGSRALAKVADGSEADCMLFISGLRSGLIKQANDQFGDRLRLIEIDDWDFNDAKDPKGNRIYEFGKIPSGTYNKIQSGVFTSSVQTLLLDAVLVVKTDYLDNNSREANKIYEAYGPISNAIKARMGQTN